MTRHVDQPLVSWGPQGAPLAVVAVHGRGQAPEFMAEQSARFAVEDVRFFAPPAVGGTWYPEGFMAPLEANEPHLTDALDAISGALEQVEGAGYERIVLWGFSQGACLVAHHLLVRAPAVAGAVVFTGGFIGPEAVTGRPLADVPVVVRSIENDPWVPATRVRETASALTAAGADVDLLIAPGEEHIITDEAYTAGSALLADVARRAT